MKTRSNRPAVARASAGVSLDRSGTERMSAVLLALFLGVVFVYGVGFSPVAHDLAHDTRHAIGFPCH